MRVEKYHYGIWLAQASNQQSGIKMLNRKTIVGALLVAFSAIGTAQADTVQLNGFLGGLSSSVDLNSPRDGNFSAGEYAGLWNGNSFSSVCVDVMHNISFGPVYSNYTAQAANAYGFSAAKISLFNKLYTNHYSDSRTSSDKAAAFQIAAWEITNDGDSSLNIYGGSFTMGSGGSANAKGIATSWLNTLGNQQTGNWQFTVLNHTGQQDLLVATPVPEPSEVALLLGGLGLIGSVIRRRRTTPRIA